MSPTCCESDADCDDDDSCTLDACLGGDCSYQPHPEGSACDDGDACTSGDSCSDGECEGQPVICEPLDQCHLAGTCDPATGVCDTPLAADGSACDDQNDCTTPGVCQQGVCAGEPLAGCCTAAEDCTDAAPCTLDSCDPASGLCTNDPMGLEGEPCDDGNACTDGDACAVGACAGVPVVCETSPCEAATCNSVVGCVFVTLPDGSACDDANACTQGEACAGGACIDGAAIVCAAPGPCQKLEPCSANEGCVYSNAADGMPCEDDDLCTENETCGAGVCVGSLVACDSEAPCTATGCSPETGCSLADGVPCDDGDPCTEDDQCMDGVCGGTPACDTEDLEGGEPDAGVVPDAVPDASAGLDESAADALGGTSTSGCTCGSRGRSDASALWLLIVMGFVLIRRLRPS